MKMKRLKYCENYQNKTEILASKCYWKNDANRLTSMQGSHKLSICENKTKKQTNTVSVKRNKMRCACTHSCQENEEHYPEEITY